MKQAAWLLGSLAGACRGGTPPLAVDASPTLDASPADTRADAPVDALAPAFSFVPASLDFGYVLPGTASAPIHLVVVNNTNVTVPDFSLTLSGDDTIDLNISQTDCMSTLRGGDCSMDMEFVPRTDGVHMMTITATAPGQPSATASIHAIGGMAPHPFRAAPRTSMQEGTAVQHERL